MDKVKVVCRALVIDEEAGVLFVKKTGSDFWSLPGGMLETDDSSLQSCLMRELQEELGVDATIKEIRFVQEMQKDNSRYVELIWEVTVGSDPAHHGKNIKKVSGEELEDVRWIKMQDLQSTNIKPEFLRELA